MAKEQAVTEWLALTHYTSIDEYLDTLTNLMWRTGYPEEVAKDKLVRGLNKEVGLAWAQTPNKPRTLHEQMAMLRDIGHNLENFHHLQSQGRSQGSGSGQGRSQRNGRDNKGKEEKRGKKRSREETEEYKDRETELKGIPKNILDERKQADTCLKCGKGTHKWYECWKKEPVTSKVTDTKKRTFEKQDGKKKDEKKKEVKISAVQGPDENGGRIIELVTDSDGEYSLLK